MKPFQSELDSLVGNTSQPVGRRDFIKTAVSVGFATAVLPVCAQTMIETDIKGLEDKKFNLEVDGQAVPVYMAKPKGKRNLPVVIVISEIFGLHEHIADVARRFAKQGYLAIAPDFFVRQGDPLAYDNIATLLKDVISKVPDKQVFGDLDACVAWAKKRVVTPTKLPLPDFVGAVAWFGCMPHIILISKLASPGMAASSMTVPHRRCNPSIR
jgi:carboxymethylenebutenolidase